MSKKDIAHQARLLRQASPAVASETPAEQLRALTQESRNSRTFDAATECPECTALRVTNPDALCRTHLAQALGF